MDDIYKTVKERIKAGEFEHKLPYPLVEELANHEKYQELTKKINQLEVKMVELKRQRSVLISDMIRAYEGESSEIRVNFRAAMEKEYNMQHHPKRDKIWMKAWDEGHSGGWESILDCYNDLFELIE